MFTKIVYIFLCKYLHGNLTRHIFDPTKQAKDMTTRTTLSNATDTKRVNIAERTDLGYTSVFAQYVQVYKGEEQVLQSKSFSTLAAAQRWSKKILA